MSVQKDIEILLDIKDKKFKIKGIFGNQNLTRSDIDLIIIMKDTETLKKCMTHILDLILFVYQKNINAYFTPTFELKSFLRINKQKDIIHFLLYPSFWAFLKIESFQLANNILIATNNEQLSYSEYENLSNTENYLFNYFDIIQKIINSLILLLNREPENKLLFEEHAYNTLLYAIKWLPISNKQIILNKLSKSSKISFEEAIVFYRILIEKL